MAHYKIRHIRIIILLIICSLETFGQGIKLNKGKKIDTLYVSLVQNDKSVLKLQEELQTQFDSLIKNFNLNRRTYKILNDSTHSSNSIRLTMGPIKYVDLKRNLLVTGLDLAMVGANILILPYFPPVIPFYLMPATYCKVKTSFTPDLVQKSPTLSINPNGYLRNKDKQRNMFKSKFNKVFLKLFIEIDKQNHNNNEP